MSVYCLTPAGHTWLFVREIVVIRDLDPAEDEPLDEYMDMWTPAIDGNEVYVADRARAMHGYDLSSGKKINEFSVAKWSLHRYLEGEPEDDEEYVCFC